MPSYGGQSHGPRGNYGQSRNQSYNSQGQFHNLDNRQQFPQQDGGFRGNNSMQFIAKKIIMQYSNQLFMNYDKNGSGFLGVNEMYEAIVDFFRSNNAPPPSLNQVVRIMKKFDHDGNGLIDMAEFQKLLLILNGV